MPSDPRTDSLYHGDDRATSVRLEPTVSVADAVVIVALAIATFIVASGVTFAALGRMSPIVVVVGQAMLVVVPVVFVRARRYPRAILGVRAPAAGHLAAAAMIGVALWFPTLFLLQFLPFPKDAGAPIAKMVALPSLATTVAAYAVVPALCEELLFRGVLLRALSRRFDAAVAVLVSALAFSLYHLNLAQLAPSFVLGLALGAVSLRARSIIPAMLIHAINNAVAIGLVRGELDPVIDALSEYPVAGLGLAVSLVGLGFVAMGLVPPKTPNP